MAFFFLKSLVIFIWFCRLNLMHTHKPVITNSIDQMSSDPNIVRLTFLTTFFHSMIVTLLIVLNTNKLFVQYTQKGSDLGKIPQFLVDQINGHNVILWFIFIVVILFLLYSIVYPIGQSAVIHYLHHKKSIRDSLQASFRCFYPMFEFWFVGAIFSPITFLFFAFKFFILDWSRGFLPFFLFVLWIIIISTANALKIYTRYFIVLHKLPLYESIRNSVLLASKSFKETKKYMTMQTWLLISFSLNFVLIIGLPLLLIHFALLYDAISFWYIRWFVYILFFLLVIAGAYMSSFIRSFFVYYRYDIFMQMAPPKK